MVQHILGPEWNLSPDGINMVTENGAIKDPKIVLKKALDSDLKIIGRGALASEFSKGQLLGKIVLQIQKIRNISAPKAKEESQAAPRMLKLTLTDGETYIQAIEGAQINSISREKTAPGTKVVLNNVKFVSGFLMINPQNFNVLGGQVEHLYDKWLLAKSVQQNHQQASNDGAPSWVPFGKKIVTCNSDGSFKSLEKGKDEAGHSEFDQQRQEAIAEVSTGAVKKTFGGRVKQNVQPVQNNQSYRGRNNDKGDNDRTNRRGKFSTREDEVPDKFQKPSEKVSLFSFLEDKLPVTEVKKPAAPSPSCNQNNCTDYHQKDPRIQQKPRSHSHNVPGRFEQKNVPAVYKGQSQKHIVSNNEIGKSTDSRTNSANTKPTANSGDLNSSRNTQHRYPKDSLNQAIDSSSQYQQKNNNVERTQQFSNAASQKSHSSNDRSQPRDNFSHYRNNNEKYLQQQNHHSSNTQGYYSNTRQHSYNNYSNNHQSQHQQSIESQANNQQNGLQLVVQNAEMHQLANNLSKMSVSNEFASRSLRQHLNLGPLKKVDTQQTSAPSESTTLNIGDPCMAKYWEDGKFYPAVVAAITDKTFAVQFKGYGNIEEVLKNDCFSATHGHNNDSYNPQNRANNYNGYQQNHYTGTMEFRSRRGPPRN